MIKVKRSNDVLYELSGGILTVTINRSEKRNPLSLGVLDELREIFTLYEADESVRLAVLTGSGDKAFASGGDLVELAEYRSVDEAEAFSRHGKKALDAIRHFPVPVIARINGVAFGGGCELALACDQRIAASHARLGMIHSRLAIAPSWGGSIDLVRLLGPAVALRLMVGGEILDACKALSIGLIDAVCPQEEGFAPWFDAKTAVWAANPPQVMRALKAITAGARAGDRAKLGMLETTHFAKVWAHEDHWSAVDRSAGRSHI